jgi:hypothetical protein
VGVKVGFERGEWVRVFAPGTPMHGESGKVIDASGLFVGVAVLRPSGQWKEHDFYRHHLLPCPVDKRVEDRALDGYKGAKAEAA